MSIWMSIYLGVIHFYYFFFSSTWKNCHQRYDEEKVERKISTNYRYCTLGFWSRLKKLRDVQGIYIISMYLCAFIYFYFSSRRLSVCNIPSVDLKKKKDVLFLFEILQIIRVMICLLFYFSSFSWLIISDDIIIIHLFFISFAKSREKKTSI